MSFDPTAVKAFRFTDCRFDEITATASLGYAFDDEHEFEEELVFRGAPTCLPAERRKALEHCLHHLHLVAGVSYYKAAIPPEIRVETRPIDRATAGFLDRLYERGLAEFAYENDLDLAGRISFPFTEDAASEPARVPLARRSAVPVGGGKDSVVTIEALRVSGEPMVLFSVGDFEPIRHVSEVAGLDRLVVERRISERLLELNREGAYNGHVPISAIIAFVSAAAAVLYDFDTVVMSNERSADAPNLTGLGWGSGDVNHQYSKSSRFELDVADQFASRVLDGFRYFSLLRAHSELYISSRFAHHRQYHPVFRSCNAAFRQDKGARARRWCSDCAKCRSVFLCLAPFLERTELLEIFGTNLLGDAEQAEGFEALLGIGAHKPFECVAEAEECVAALALLADRDDWKADLLVERFTGELELAKRPVEELLERALEEGPAPNIPEEFRDRLPPLSAVRRDLRRFHPDRFSAPVPAGEVASTPHTSDTRA